MANVREKLFPVSREVTSWNKLHRPIACVYIVKNVARLFNQRVAINMNNINNNLYSYITGITDSTQKIIFNLTM